MVTTRRSAGLAAAAMRYLKLPVRWRLTSTQPILTQRVRIGQLEFLHPLSIIDLGRVDIPLGINRDGMHPVKLTGVAAAAAEVAHYGAVFAVENPHLVI